MLRYSSLPNHAESVPQARRLVDSFLGECGIDEEVRFPMLLAVTEAVTNACRHGARPDGAGHIRLGVACENADVVVAVRDDGPGFEMLQDHMEPADLDATGGRGLHMIMELCDHVQVSSSPLGTIVVMRCCVEDSLASA